MSRCTLWYCWCRQFPFWALFVPWPAEIFRSRKSEACWTPNFRGEPLWDGCARDFPRPYFSVNRKSQVAVFFCKTYWLNSDPVRLITFIQWRLKEQGEDYLAVLQDCIAVGSLVDWLINRYMHTHTRAVLSRVKCITVGCDESGYRQIQQAVRAAATICPPPEQVVTNLHTPHTQHPLYINIKM